MEKTFKLLIYENSTQTNNKATTAAKKITERSGRRTKDQDKKEQKN